MNEDNNNKIKGDYGHQKGLSNSEYFNHRQKTINWHHEPIAFKDLLKQWNFTKSECETLKALIKLGESATCLEISSLCNSYQSTINIALKKLKDRKLVKKDESTHIWFFIGKEEFQEVLTQRIMKFIKLLYSDF